MDADPRSLGPYQIRQRLGAGGMGVVYLAEDTRLGRSVALKVLPSSADAVALGRFVREARTVAALQHPHIAVLHDVGEEDGTSYLVMERIDGETLSSVLARGPLPWREALRLGLELASALVHAHGLGVLHRDVKPGNIMLCPARGAVLLDFGLAQRVLRAKPADDQPTETMDRLTRAGAVVGTVSYLSPEQIEERPLDARSDLFQLGITLYESAAGLHPFYGPTGVDVMHAILRVAPAPLHEVAPVPEELSRIVGRLLEKEPEYRHPDARALEADLRHLERTSAAWSAPVRSPARPSRGKKPASRALGPVAAVVVAAAGVGVGRFWAGSAGSPAVPARVVPLTDGRGNDSGPSFSPDGRSVVFASDRSGNGELWVALVAGGEPVAITRTPEQEGMPAWSPDGSRVAFQRARPGGTRSDILVMPALGGDARKLVEDASDPAWSPDGRSLAYADFASGWARIATIPVAPGGQPAPVTAVEEGYFHRRPAWSPDGRTIVFNRSPGGRVGMLMRVAAGGGAPQPLTRDPEGTANIAAAVTPDGRHVVHVSDRGGDMNLWRVSTAGGRPERITAGPGQHLEPQVSRDGRRIVFVHSPVATRLLAHSPATGRTTTLVSLLGSEAWAPRASRDGAHVVFSRKVAGSPWKLALLDRATGSMRTVLEGLPDVLWARFHPDGGSVLFDTRFPEGGRIGHVGLDGRGLRWLTAPGTDASYPDVSPDARRIAFVRGRAGGADIVVRDLSGGPERVVVTGATLPAFSPDGRRLLFARSRSFSGGVGVVEVAGGEPRWLTSSGTWPTWDAGGGAVLYADVGPEGDQAAWSVGVGGGAPKPVARFRWHGAHYPFALDRGELITSDWTETKSTLWLAEY